MFHSVTSRHCKHCSKPRPQRLSSFRLEKLLHRLLYYGVSSKANKVDYQRENYLPLHMQMLLKY